MLHVLKIEVFIWKGGGMRDLPPPPSLSEFSGSATGSVQIISLQQYRYLNKVTDVNAIFQLPCYFCIG